MQVRTIIAALVVAGFCGGALAAPQILLPVAPEKLAQARAKSSTLGYTRTLRTPSTPIAFDAASLHAVAIGEEAVFSLPNGQSYIFIAKNITRDEYGNVSWVGQLKNFGARYNVVATTGPAGTFATIDTPESEWMILPGENGSYGFLVNGSREADLSVLRPNRDDAVPVPENVMRKELEAALESRRTYNANQHDAHDHASHDHSAHGQATSRVGPAQDGALVPTTSGAFWQNTPPSPTAFMTKAAPTPQRTIDVLMVVTQGFANFHGANLETRLAQAIAGANTSLTNSEVAITLRKVGPTLIRNYPDSSAAASSAELDAVTNNVGVFADLEDQRWAHGADLVTLITQPPPNSGSGIAWLGRFSTSGGVETWTSSRNMYSVVALCNFSGCDSGLFAHELGHNMGLAHDQANASSAPSRPYAYGWKINSGNNARDFRTVMSYAPPGRSVPVFANPNLFICNPAGWSPLDACGQANAADTARTLNENRAMIANIKTATQVTFAAGGTQVSPGATVASVQVSRVGGTAQSISVNYATSNGTATAGVDYTASSGTLTWAANDATPKTINVPIVANTGAASRTFSVTLSNPLRTTITAPDAITFTHLGSGGGSVCPVRP